LREALDAFMSKLARKATGEVRFKLYKGSLQVIGRRSENSLYDFAMATYDKGDLFDHKASEGFIKLWGLPTKIYSMIDRKE
jgi:argininosuccinate synthase